VVHDPAALLPALLALGNGLPSKIIPCISRARHLQPGDIPWIADTLGPDQAAIAMAEKIMVAAAGSPVTAAPVNSRAAAGCI
jgi:hypothetical protein